MAHPKWPIFLACVLLEPRPTASRFSVVIHACTPISLEKSRQEVSELQVSLGYVIRLCVEDKQVGNLLSN